MTATTDCADSVPIPIATYRLQLNKHFVFSQAADCLSYLQRLGISHCYVSPYLKARPGSNHGYDIVDHNVINPELGGEVGFEYFFAELQRHGLKLISDIVPNHMGVMGADNAWWLDVLENGPASTYAHFFDIDWHPVKKVLDNKILIPVLGDQYGNILERGELQLKFAVDRGEFSIYYYQHRFPLDPKTYPFILNSSDLQLLTHFQDDDPVLLEYQTLENSFSKLPQRSNTSVETVEERARDKEVFKTQLARLCTDNPCLTRYIEHRIAQINRETSDRDELHAILEQQPYRLSYWHVAGDEINYRRFFDFKDLAGLRTEEEAVFLASHRLILNLIEQGKIHGLRVDHADGLYDPIAYYQRLKTIPTAMGMRTPSLYIIAEKIVANYEYLDNDWPIHGATGYEFSAAVNGVFIDTAAEKKLTAAYRRFTGRREDFDEVHYQAKKRVMGTSLASELNMLANQLSRIAEANCKTRDFTLNALRDALSEIAACFPVYRTYINGFTVRKEDSKYVDWAIQQAKQKSWASDKTVFDFVRSVLLLEADGTTVISDTLLKFVMRFQQYTAPVMAKGYEDTALYQYHRLISLNDVGSDPRHFGFSVNAFHHFNQARVKKWPHSLLSLSSHDSKRSADVRARINVLSEIPRQWYTAAMHWHRLNRTHNKCRAGLRISRNDEYLLYQTLIGTWPLHDLDESEWIEYRQRIETYMIKAVREAKQSSCWLNPNADYEQAVTDFISESLGTQRNTAFLRDFTEFELRLRPAGLTNALAQTLLLLTSPGVPDIYQGNELWRFDLVDPDNRRPVDFATTDRLAAELDALASKNRSTLLDALQQTIGDGRIKLFVILQTLRYRNRHVALFRDGDYLSIDCEGERAEHLLAFARRKDNRFALIVAPRLTLSLFDQAKGKIPPDSWRNTWLTLPQDAPTQFRELFSKQRLQCEYRQNLSCLSAAKLFEKFPVALLTQTTRR